MTLILSVDCGLTGALAWLRKDKDGSIHLLAVADMPTAMAKQGATVKAHLQSSALAAIMHNPVLPKPDACVIEQVGAMPKQGVTSMFRFGYAAGMVEGCAAALGLPIHFMRSNQWQPLAGVRHGDDAGRLRATQLFPAQAMEFARKKDHNRADAALIGYAFLKLF